MDDVACLQLGGSDRGRLLCIEAVGGWRKRPRSWRSLSGTSAVSGGGEDRGGSLGAGGDQAVVESMADSAAERRATSMLVTL